MGARRYKHTNWWYWVKSPIGKHHFDPSLYPVRKLNINPPLYFDCLLVGVVPLPHTRIGKLEFRYTYCTNFMLAFFMCSRNEGKFFKWIVNSSYSNSKVDVFQT